MRRGWAALVLGVVLALPAGAQTYSNPSAVVGSSHDFSSASPAPYKAQAQNEVCVFCHTPHNANPKAPLWNHTLSGANYTTYSSSTLAATVGQPLSTDASKLCLSCHDGTVALGSTVNNGAIPFQNGVTTIPATDRSNLGTNLGDDHPVAFTPLLPALPAYPQVKAPANGDPVTLPAGRLQCTSCHEPHEELRDATEKRFLVKNNSGAAVCVSCHDLQSVNGAPNPWSWSGAKGQVTNHKTATNTYNASTNDGGITWLGSHTGYTTTATNACAACHRPHTAHDAARLLKSATDQVCFQCHDGNAITNIPQNIATAFSSKLYQHPGTGASQTGHDPNETPIISGSRHAACDDCHNPHAASSYSAAPVRPNVAATLVGESGVSSAGLAIDPRRGSGEVAYQYQICFKCHADSTNKPQSATYAVYGRTPFRLTMTGLPDPYNVRLEFQSTVARHNVTQARNVSSVPSLRSNMLDLNGNSTNMPSLGAGTYLYCTDCHSNNQDRAFNGTGPNGVHGSNNAHLLERQYALEPLPATPGGSGGGVSYSGGINGTYALCYKCHDIDNSILQNQSFKEHNTHVSGANASCATCHAPHGIQGGNTTNNYSLVNFDLGVVGPSSSGTLRFDRTGTYSGRCYLRCHGMDHNPESY